MPTGRRPRTIGPSGLPQRAGSSEHTSPQAARGFGLQKEIAGDLTGGGPPSARTGLSAQSPIDTHPLIVVARGRPACAVARSVVAMDQADLVAGTMRSARG